MAMLHTGFFVVKVIDFLQQTLTLLKMLYIIKCAITMNLIIYTILKEKTRIEYMLKRYRRIIDELPKGSLSKSNKNGRKYYYLKYRERKKVITKHLGKDAGNILALIEKRKHTEAMIKSFEALHTTGINYIIEDIDLYIEAR